MAWSIDLLNGDLAHVDVDVEVDVRNTTLARSCASRLMQRPRGRGALLTLASLRHRIAAACAALAAELPRQYGFLAILVGADDMRTPVRADNRRSCRSPACSRGWVAEEGVGGEGIGSIYKEQWLGASKACSRTRERYAGARPDALCLIRVTLATRGYGTITRKHHASDIEFEGGRGIIDGAGIRPRGNSALFHNYFHAELLLPTLP